MKTYFKIALCLLLIVSCFLTACGGKTTAATEPTLPRSATGRYEIQSITWEDGTTTSGEALQEQLAMMGETFLEIHEDGTALLCLYGQRADMEYDATTMWRTGSSLVNYDFSVKDGKAVLKDTLASQSPTFTFVKK